jgi:hypothetical protein
MNEVERGELSNGSNSEVTDFHRLVFFSLFENNSNRYGTKEWRCRVCVERLETERWRDVIKLIHATRRLIRPSTATGWDLGLGWRFGLDSIFRFG